MADTLNMLVHNKIVPKLIETNNFMIINGTLYQKSNLSSMKKAFSFGSDLGNNILHISRSMHLMDNARIDKRFKEPLIHEDKYEENVSYIILNDQYANATNTKSFLLKLIENEADVSISKQISFDNIILKEIFDITSQYIFISGINSSNAYWYLYCIKKDDFSVSKTITLTNPNGTLLTGPGSENTGVPITNMQGSINLYENEDFLKFYVNGFNVKSHIANSNYQWRNGYGYIIMTVNKNTLENVLTDSHGSIDRIYEDPTTWHDHTRDFYKYNNNYYFLMQRSKTNSIYKCWINENNKFNKSVLSNDTYLFYNDTNSQMESFIKDDYLFYCIADESNTSNNIVNYQGLHKFKIDEEFNLTYEKRINPSTNKIISILFNEDYSIIIIGYYQSFDILIYEEETHNYVKVEKSFTGIKNVGLDSLNRLWYETTSGEIHTENFDDPQDVVVEFEKPYYSYLSGELETYVTFKARSATGVVPTGRYILRITTGNAYFKDSGTNELVINYESMSQDDIHYPLMITGSKRIVCNVSFEKVW